MKKIAALLLAATVLLTLSSCTEPAGDSESIFETESGMHVKDEETGKGGITIEEEDTREGYGGFVGFQ